MKQLPINASIAVKFLINYTDVPHVDAYITAIRNVKLNIGVITRHYAI